MTTASNGQGRTKLLVIAAIFAIPLIFAAFMYYGQAGWQPAGRTNHGLLLEPIVNLNEAVPAASLDTLTDNQTDGQWAVILPASSRCGDACRDGLYRMRQTRLMLGNDMTRVVRILLHGDMAPDRVWLDKEHPGLIVSAGAELGSILDEKKPAAAKPGGLFLVDPLGNLVMYFPADLAPEDLVSDLEHLLELSRIG